jgi:hypothetical protein
MSAIYEEMVKLGVEIGSHASDLYVPVTPETKAVVDQYDSKCNVTTFKNNIDGKQWYDIPFAYLPYWEKKQG